MNISPIGNTTATPGDRSVAAIDASTAAKPVAPATEAAAAQRPNAAPDRGQVAQAVKDINKAMEDRAQGLEFSVDPDTDRTVVKIIDKQTQDVIRQIPSEETLQIAKSLDKASGLLIRQKA